MNNNKPKILICSESSRVSSGFGVYNKKLIEKLYSTNKYEIAEFASYGLVGDKEKHNIPWKYYPNAVTQSDSRYEAYNGATENHFGKWRFDRVVVDYQPDIVIDVRDYWMSAYQKNSPFRKHFHWILMPTIDSAPQQEEWLDTYIDADAIFTYSDWGRDVLLSQTSNSVKYIGTTSPGADLSVFSPNNSNSTSEIKHALRIPHHYTVIGTVMRNQKRKLFPELIAAFEKTLIKLREEGSSKADSTILYLHTSYPDAGWDLANLVKNSNVANKIYFTYSCQKCGAVFASNMAGFLQKCYKCQNQSAVLPNVSNSVNTEILAKIMTIFDVYVQYSICEGFGMPQVEAAACGVPVVTVDYSAMSDIIQKINAYPVKVGSYFKELETSAIRVYPDETSLVNTLIELINKPEQMRRRVGFDMRNATVQHYTWEESLNKWIDYIDSIDYMKYRNMWNRPKDIIPSVNLNDLPKTEIVYEIIYYIHKQYLSRLGMKMSNYWLLRQIQAAQNGFFTEQAEFKAFSITNLIENINKLIYNHNEAETVRIHPELLPQEDYITYANNS
jgi:glycosyltransferase involved in cell wall biosynthesis